MHRLYRQRKLHPRKLHLLFDYDNTLGLTEFPAFTACCKVVNQTLESKGVSFRFTTESLMARFVGFSFRRMITELAAEHNFAFDEMASELIDGQIFRPELEILVKREEVAVIAQLSTDIKPTDGINELLATLGSYNKSVVSSSAERRVRACLEGAGQTGFFAENQIFSAANYKSSKPDPRVYQEARKALGLDPEDCVAIEDSVTGARAARADGIEVIGYLGAYPKHEQAELATALIKAGACVVIPTWSGFHEALAMVTMRR